MVGGIARRLKCNVKGARAVAAACTYIKTKDTTKSWVASESNIIK